MASLTIRFVWLALAIATQSCILFTFVGGTPPLASYYVPIVPDKATAVADKVVTESAGSLTRVVSSSGSGYDTGRYRFYKIPADSILFSVHFTENDGSSAGIFIDFVGTKRFSINGGKKQSRAEQVALQAALLKIEVMFINPVKQQIGRG